jgi:chemotaxis protein CheX
LLAKAGEMGGALTDAVQQTVETVWATLLGLAVQRRSTSAIVEDAPAWAGTVKISGAWDGEVRVQCSPELAHRAAAILFAVTSANTSQAEDALRELANVTGGNLMEVLPGPSQLSMPSVWNGEGTPPHPPGLLLSRLYFECEGQPLTVVVLRTEA